MIIVTLFGKVTRANEIPVAVAAVSVEVNDPYASSVHIALLHSGNDGSYSDTFELESSHSAGNYTIYVTASKVGYEDGQARLTFKIGIAPFKISILPSLLNITKGETGTFRIRLESNEQLSSIVHVEVIGLPPSVSYGLSSDNVTSPSTVTLTVKIPEELQPGSYSMTVLGRSREGESKANAEIVVREPDRSGYYVVAAVAVIVLLSTILVIRRKAAVKKPIEPSMGVPEYLDNLALSPSTLISLPDHLRKTAIIICNLKEASANEVASKSGRARAAESDYLNQLVRMGLIKKKRKGRESLFFIE